MSRRPAELSFWGHLGSLRAHLIGAAVVLGISLIIALALLGPLVSLVIASAGSYRLTFLSPVGPLGFEMRLTCLVAFALSIGPWAGLLVHFISPALPDSAHRWTIVIVVAGLLLCAIAFGATYLWIFPWSLRVFARTGIAGAQMLLTGDAYLNLFAVEVAIVAAWLDLPLVLALLTFWGLLNPSALSRRRDVLYVVLLLLMATITPTTDIVSLLVSMIPAALSLEGGLLAARLIHTHRQQRRRARGKLSI